MITLCGYRLFLKTTGSLSICPKTMEIKCPQAGRVAATERIIILLIATGRRNKQIPAQTRLTLYRSLDDDQGDSLYPPGTLIPVIKSHENHRSQTPETPQPTHDRQDAARYLQRVLREIDKKKIAPHSIPCCCLRRSKFSCLSARSSFDLSIFSGWWYNTENQ